MTQLTEKDRSLKNYVFIAVFILFNYSENYTDLLYITLPKIYCQNMIKVVLNIQLFIDYINCIIYT